MRLFIAVKRALSKHPLVQHGIGGNIRRTPAEADNISASQVRKHWGRRYGAAMTDGPPLSVPHKRAPFTRVVWLFGDAGEVALPV